MYIPTGKELKNYRVVRILAGDREIKFYFKITPKTYGS